MCFEIIIFIGVWCCPLSHLQFILILILVLLFWQFFRVCLSGIPSWMSCLGQTQKYKIHSELKSNNLVSLVPTLQLLCLNHELEGFLSGWPCFPLCQSGWWRCVLGQLGMLFYNVTFLSIVNWTEITTYVDSNLSDNRNVLFWDFGSRRRHESEIQSLKDWSLVNTSWTNSFIPIKL